MKYLNKETAAAVVGVLAIAFGWGVELQGEVLNSVIVAGGTILTLWGRIQARSA